MPYVDQNTRSVLGVGIKPRIPGELGYALAKVIDDYLAQKKKPTVKQPAGRRLKFADYGEVLGVLESIKLEYYRRILAPYEDSKLAENGDVFTVLPK